MSEVGVAPASGGRLRRDWGERIDREVHYAIVGAWGTYWPAADEDRDSTLILETLAGERRSIRVVDIEPSPSGARARFRVLRRSIRRRVKRRRWQKLVFGLSVWMAVPLPVAFSLWSVGLVISVTELRRSVERDVGMTAGLTTIQERVREIEAASLPGEPVDAARAIWIRESAQIADALALLDAQPTGVADIAAQVALIREVFDAAETRWTAGGATEEVLVQVLKAAHKVRAETAAALRIIRARLETQSVTLGNRWTQLTLAAIGSVVLAFTFAALLILYARTHRELSTLRGILPICMYCKRVRDDRNFWEQVDRYVAQHSEIIFSHGICPSCAQGIKLTGDD